MKKFIRKCSLFTLLIFSACVCFLFLSAREPFRPILARLTNSQEFLEDSGMLPYFERNGVDPRTSINGKFKTLELQGIERIIKIIRAIEKDKIDKLLPASEAHSDDLLKQADKQVTQLKAEVERLKKASAPDVVGRNKLGQVVRLLENAFDQKNFKKAEKGTDYFVAPVYLEMLLYKVKEICS